MRPFQEQYVPTTPAFRYRDPGINLAYDRAIDQHQTYNRTFKSTDPALNAMVGLQTANKVAELELDRGMQNAKAFGLQNEQHQALLAKDAENRLAIINRNAERANQLNAYKLKMQGAKIAQDQGIVQGLITDVSKT